MAKDGGTFAGVTRDGLRKNDKCDIGGATHGAYNANATKI